MTDTLTLWLPLPPTALRSNSRAHWRTKMAAKQRYSNDVYEHWIDLISFWGPAARRDIESRIGWEAADVTYTWCYCGVAPDIGNLGANLKALQDILCCAPNTGKLTTNNTTYLGLVKDDKHIRPTYRMERVSRRAAQGVRVEMRRTA